MNDAIKVPPALARAVVESAIAGAPGSALVQAIVQGTAITSRLKLAATVLSVCAAICVGAGIAIAPTPLRQLVGPDWGLPTMSGDPYSMQTMGSGSGMMPGMGGFSGGSGMPNFNGFGMPNTGGFGVMGIGMQPNPAFAVTSDGINTSGQTQQEMNPAARSPPAVNLARGARETSEWNRKGRGFWWFSWCAARLAG